MFLPSFARKVDGHTSYDESLVDRRSMLTCLGLLYFNRVTGFEKYLVERMVDMKGLLNDVMRRQKETNLRLDQLIKRGAVSSIQKLPVDVEFPLATVTDVDSLEGNLVDLRLQECIVSVSFNTYPASI